ncbi:MAG: hypothetical protein ABW275_01840 [Hansschlegelia sp.]
MKMFFCAIAAATLVSTAAYARGDNGSNQRYLDAMARDESRIERNRQPVSVDLERNIERNGGRASKRSDRMRPADHHGRY